VLRLAKGLAEGVAMAEHAGMQPGVQESLYRELRSLRDKVTHIQGSLVATSDGLLLADDIPHLEPTRIAALIATTLGLAKQATIATGLGEFREAVAQGSDGYLMVYAAGPSTVVAIIGDHDLNVAMLRYEARETIAFIADQSAGFARWAGGASAELPKGHDEYHSA
jgi:predicted regulator of Ras-like GTPase activity (Roadblock/LC7/MglB family)